MIIVHLDFIVLKKLFSFDPIKIIVTKSSLYLPFETQSPTKLTPDNFFDTKFKNEPKIDIKVGTHRQTIPCYLNLNTPTFYIGGSNSMLAKNQVKYDESK